jgi:NAD(P)-dependent dehydrogenase (short-subunit alcohol dehydrogenase family)
VASRSILVTGATRGLGRMLVEHYLASGDLVTGSGRGAATIEHERYTPRFKSLNRLVTVIYLGGIG